MLLIPLGINGFFPFNNRHTSCYLVMPSSNTAFLLDAGTGIIRLLKPEVKAKLEQVQELHIILSHYHLDHTSGLFYLTGVWPNRKVVCHAPGYPLVEADPLQALEKLLGPPLYPLRLNDLPLEIEAVTEPRKEIAGLEFRFRPQQHPGSSVGIRVGDYLAYITDTVADPQTAEFARGVNLLMHEVWLTDEEAEHSIEADGVPARAKHSWVGAVAEITKKAEVNLFAPIHHAPWRTDDEILLLAQDIERKCGTPVLALQEGNEYLISLPKTTGTLKK
ncbi:Ribonuclease BN, tRNA processing enzyme [Thermanaeromonas toyohensis ToBE]|uniref:Ribonuclease BN, tRNA processing enzyme n=1 Tax=Thermanaeromonas toyohensis ToBE TaxID=698762 RepID=A0A1W1VS52_9FIRM|nr:MBL fold metallo-hydrolase [Thermanaeromonas toyohensis]SMB96187.1 Ribonuclease BN, tRNA processing enzyme [Thermanaeromonas toyohensis ToBE]